ncbi:cytochrome P450 [Mycobacteroides franklinii]|uniref:Biotin biosynthesis cytochrome P450 n=1 Tax=Mycobacteroides franklinii TaxID=948102 RepID=A0A4R8R6R7_9MYCO|nr:cytochrome P450 [Mycobacteroides franklinii]TDZ42925.1 Biotin biosynthesis cytochrome P450 [Mycobacteroides franklinii]TDZ50059.1 Biotin biosynthesis cytochrome P450 [Mycobacteroides franklinii]TDZ56480.1 Biotin biosynthesis cytochrome P450 [Mycobacteroides franklinii]TDZ63421.1 Biotin biosynthesis cytochrome P450 [Mycobacteroides franklinii]TDZ69818.1 Biotin biosynthesis cytochrome P450 [Mycobacteroides franklinii]
MTTANPIAPRIPWDSRDPYQYYENLRSRGDVVWDENAGTWLVLGYQAAREVLGGSGWSSDPLASPQMRAAAPEYLDMSNFGRNMLFADGPDHTELRGAVRDVFTPGFIAGLRQGVQSIASHVVEYPLAGISFDFMADIALPLPIAIIGEWLGLDDSSSAVLREESPIIIQMLGAFADVDTVMAGTAAGATLATELLPLAADRRAHPGDDLLSLIASDPNLSLEDVVTMAFMVAIAGHETTANLLGASMVRLLAPREDGSQLADHIDPDDPAVITELLRLDGPVLATARVATEEHHLGGHTIQEGQTVLIAIAAANRDPQVFVEPAEFRPDRKSIPPLAFGYGTHHCLGSALARLETTVALHEVLARRPVITGPVSWRDTPAIRGPRSIPLHFQI